jgi:glucosylceramidase
MKCLKIIVPNLALAALLIACVHDENLISQPFSASVTVTTNAAPWQAAAPVPVFTGMGGWLDLELDPAQAKQVIDGFGGAFNEQGWMALSVLTAEEREKVLAELFDPVHGAKFNICRVPVGASDYARDMYTLDETPGDFDMKDFSIERDRRDLIPYVKLAMKYRPDLRIWGSVWTPPTWMKLIPSFKGGRMRDDPRYYSAYALYLARFVEEYRKEGINVFAVAIQNEPTVTNNYPSCAWDPGQFRTFIRDHLGPTFAERSLDAQIMIGTISEPSYITYPLTVLSDERARRYVGIIGYQWEGVKAVARTRREFPDKTIMETETDCGNWHWAKWIEGETYNPDRPPNDRAYGVRTWGKVKDYFEAGVNSYMLWNMVLDEFGKNINPALHWPQNAAVVVEQSTRRVVYTPMFYAFKHFSYFVQPGAHYLEPKRRSPNAIAFRNPDKSVVVIAENNDPRPRQFRIKIGEDGLILSLPAASWSTIVVPAP